MLRSIVIFIALAFAAIVFLPDLFTMGMFTDGLTYASIARNLSQGIGSFWQPHYTNSLLPHFYGHPPLAIGIQSLVFSICGDQFFVERTYSFVLFISCACWLLLIWRAMFNNKAVQHDGWMVVIFWLLMPVCSWCFRSNMLENTLTFFALGAFWGLLSTKVWKTIVASIFVLCAFLCKGPVGLFPIVVPAVAMLYEARPAKVVIKQYLLLFSVIATLCIALMTVWPFSVKNFEYYLQEQLMASLMGNVSNHQLPRYGMPFYLAKNLLIPLLVATFLRSCYKQKHQTEKKILVLLTVAISGSLPLLISPRQSEYYLLPSLPFYALAITVWCQPSLHYLSSVSTEKIRTQIQVLCVIVIAISVTLMFIRFGKPSRDSDTIALVEAVVRKINRNTSLGCDVSFHNNWKLHAYFARIGNISMYPGNESYPYFLSTKMAAGKNSIEIKQQSGEPLFLLQLH